MLWLFVNLAEERISFLGVKVLYFEIILIDPCQLDFIRIAKLRFLLAVDDVLASIYILLLA